MLVAPLGLDVKHWSRGGGEMPECGKKGYGEPSIAGVQVEVCCPTCDDKGFEGCAAQRIDFLSLICTPRLLGASFQDPTRQRG